MSRCLALALTVTSLVISSQRAEAVEVVTINSLLHEMTDRDEAARFPQQGFRLKQASSYNRASKTPEDPKGWFDNFDRSTSDKHKNFVRIEENGGRKEWVVMEDEGAGAITRFWVPWRNQLKPGTDIVIRFYFDGATVPAIEGNMFELFQGKGLIPFPLAHESLRSAVSFFPMPYAKSCKVTMSDHPFFFQFTYREYDDDVAVKTFTMAEMAAARTLIAETCDELLNAGSGTRQESRPLGRSKVLATSATLNSGEESDLHLPAGVAAIRNLSLKLGDYSNPEVTRTVVLRISFDGKETVWCPIGDFFGCGIGLNPFQDWYRTVAEDGTMGCRWVMPYQRSATVSIVNLGSDPVEVDLSASVGDWQWDDRSMVFHAGWRGQYPVPTRPYSDWNYVHLTGRGVYVGDTLTIMNPVQSWWGEGDEKIFVDGEKFPSIFGTGTEDYYAYSWGGRSTDFYEHPFHSQTFSHKYNKLHRKPTINGKEIDEKNTQGYSTETRIRALDTIPFVSSLQLDMEVWSWEECDMGYGVGCYWYGDAATTSNRTPDAEGVRNVPPLPEEMSLNTATGGDVSKTPGPMQDASTSSATQTRPNIILLISDDDDYEHFGFMGDTLARTPTLDSLANFGTLFTTAHCPAPLCRPSLASLLSGKLPHQHGIYANYLQKRRIGGDRIKLDPTGSLANRLKDAGYATYATAKYWEGDPRLMGFTHGTVNTTFKGFQKFVRDDQTELFEFINQQGKDKPMFIWWAPLLPHKPHNPPAKYFEPFAQADIPIPAFYNGDRKAYVDASRKFYAMGAWFDDGVAELIQTLKNAGEYENTIFLFYVDNGYSFGIPAKNSPTEKGLRTPMLVSWPGKPGRIPVQRIDDLADALDLHATALDYAGIKPADDIASQSLRPRIEETQTVAKEAIFGAVFAHAPAAYAGDPVVERSAERDVYALYARTKRWKYVLYTQDLSKNNDGYIWMVHELSDALRRRKNDQDLYDLEADPYEQADLAEHPENMEVITELRQQTLDWWRATGGKRLPL